MVILAAGRLLDLWERAWILGPVDRALELAEATGADPAALLGSPLGETHRAVLDLRESLLGSDLAALASCPTCTERVEFALNTTRLRALVGEPGTDAGRPPTPTDLLAVVGSPNPGAALVSRRVVGDNLAGAEELMTAADPLAEVLVGLTCPQCGTGFEADVDVGAFVWAEVDVAARRLLHEVHVEATISAAAGPTAAHHRHDRPAPDR